MLIALCQSTCSCSCQCSTTIMKRMKQATLFGFLVLNMLIILCLSDWFASNHALRLQEWIAQVNQKGLTQRILWRLHTQVGVASHPIHPPWISPCPWKRSSSDSNFDPKTLVDWMILHDVEWSIQLKYWQKFCDLEMIGVKEPFFSHLCRS